MVGCHEFLCNLFHILSLFQRKGLKKTTQKRKTWKRWTDAEKDALKRAFILNISRGVSAQKADVLKAQHNFPTLNGRPVAQITSQVNNLIRKKKKEK